VTFARKFGGKNQNDGPTNRRKKMHNM